MIKKILFTLSLSTLALMALGSGDCLPKLATQKLSLQNDKIYIIDFFASWCHSCQKELPLMTKLNNSIDKNKTEIIGIDVDEDIEEGKTFQKELALNFKVIDDTNNEIIGTFNPVGMPSVFIVKNSQIIAVIAGAKENIDSYILEGLKDLK